MSLYMTSTFMRAINLVAGKHGEHAASLVLNHLPQRWVPSTGTHNVRRCGLRWSLELSDNLQKRLYLVGAYESLTMKILLSRVRPNDVVLDVGANIGVVSLPIAKRVRSPGCVVAVEAAKDTSSRLRAHVAMNGLTDRVEVVEAALSSREGEGYLRVSGFGGGDVGTRTLEGESPIVGDPVRLTTGDALRRQLDLPRFDVIKIDVEGHEHAVLDGLAETFTVCPPRIVVMEIVAKHQERAGLHSKSLVDRLNQLGYHGVAIRHRGLSKLTPNFSGNALFMPH